MDEQDGGDVMGNDPRMVRHSRSRRVAGSPASGAATQPAMYYSQIDIRADSLDSIPSEDLSSGYSSGDLITHMSSAQALKGEGAAHREGMQRTASLTRAKPTRVTRSTGVVIRKGSMAEDSASEEDFQDSVEASTGENLIRNVSNLPSDAIVEQSLKNSVLSPSSNTTQLNHNFDQNTDSTLTALKGSSESAKSSSEPKMVLTEIKMELEALDDETNKELCLVESIENTVHIDTVREKLEELTTALETIDKIEKETLQSNKEMTTSLTEKPNSAFGTYANFDNESIKSKDLSESSDIRAGKYHKRHAPAVPASQHAAAITAKLVLKPGVLKPLTNPEDSSISQVFCHSPKFRRKSRGGSKSPSGSCSSLNLSRGGSKSPSRQKAESSSSPFTKLAILQKKLFGKDEGDKSEHEKRKSWHEGLLHGKMNDLFHHGSTSSAKGNFYEQDLD